MRFLIKWAAPEQGSDPDYVQAIIEYINKGKPMDSFEGFQVICRVIDPHEGGGCCIVEADNISKVYKHTAPWILTFGCEVMVTPVMTDEEYLESAKELLDER